MEGEAVGLQLSEVAPEGGSHAAVLAHFYSGICTSHYGALNTINNINISFGYDFCITSVTKMHPIVIFKTICGVSCTLKI